MSISITKKIKGFAVAKPGETTPAVASNSAAQPSSFVSEADRRLQIDTTSNLDNVLYLERRFESHEGNPSRTYMIRSPAAKFAVVIGNTGGDNPQVFEVWAVGEAPRGMSTLAKSLSLDMRARDRQYLRQKLESLAKTSGDVEPWDMKMPNGSVHSMPSEVAAFAQIVLWECERLGMFDNITETPLVDAMMSRREPKTTPDGTMSWTVDVKNPLTEDDFKMFLTEAVLPNGQQRPISLWLAGKYPKSLDGLCKALSHDMRVMPISWLLRKLDQLDDTDEVLGDFRAQIPGGEKTKQYPSTVAYISALIKHRLSVLRLIPGEGQEGMRPQLRLVGGQDTPVIKVAEPTGMLDCPSCNEKGTVKVDGGCPTCTACSWSKCQ